MAWDWYEAGKLIDRQTGELTTDGIIFIAVIAAVLTGASAAIIALGKRAAKEAEKPKKGHPPQS